MNSFTITITNCLDCPDHYIRPIYTPDSWDHEEGCYRKLVKDVNGYDKLVALSSTYKAFTPVEDFVKEYYKGEN